MDSGDAAKSEVDNLSLSTVFVDTSVLLNYVQQAVERDRASKLMDGDDIGIVVGVTVAEELEAVRERRADIYEDFVDFLLEENGEIGDYAPASRRPYFQANDEQHVRNVQMQLSQLDNRAEVQRELRRVTRSAKRRLEYLTEEVLPDATFDQQPGLTVMFALDRVIENDNDRRVVGDAALWSAEGTNSSGVFVTMDKADLVDAAEEVNAALRGAKDERWELTIVFPSQLPVTSIAD
jgi:predicted nucleic acid-binding protein